MSRLVFDQKKDYAASEKVNKRRQKNKTIQHPKKWINKGKKVSFLIKSFVDKKKLNQKAVNNAVFY